MPTNTVQGKNVVFSVYKDSWVTLLCAKEINITINADVLPIRTIGDGHWAKNTYQNISWTAALSTILYVNDFDDANFSGLDAIDNLLNFNHIPIRCTYYDDAGNMKSLQGYVMIPTVNLTASIGSLVGGDISMVGNGELKFFDGLIPCDSLITSITVTGQTASDGIVHVTYTYTGAPYQVKYRIDGTGAYFYALVGTTLDIPGLANGSHSIEILPRCLNGYDAETSTSQTFVVTHASTCSAVITDITITATTATPVYTGTPVYYKFKLDSGSWITFPIGSNVPIAGISVGAHTIEMVPICSDFVEGTGFLKAFTVTSTPTMSTISWSSIMFPYTGQFLRIYVNGIVNVNSTASSGSGTINVPVGASVMSVLHSSEPTGARSMNLQVLDTTLSTTLSSQASASPADLTFTFTANGDNYSINGVISP